MANVLVLLSIYNGCKYLDEQINSILQQKNVDVHVLVRDDGSTDGSCDLIAKYEGENLTLLRNANVGCSASFMELVTYANSHFGDYEYFAFSDQDDYWMADKMKTAVDALSRYENDKPSLYIGQYQMTDAKLNEIYTKPIKAKLTLESALINNIATGCSMVFNKELLKVICRYQPSYITMHDYWIYLLASSIGGNLIFDPVPHILYRQHGNNVIGGKDDSFMKKWSVRLSKIFKSSPHYVSRMVKELLHGYHTMISQDKLSLLEQVANPTLSNRLKLLFNSKLNGPTLDKTIKCKYLILTKKY